MSRCNLKLKFNGTPAGNHGDDGFYTLEELDQLEDASMATVTREFGHMRFRRNPNYKLKPTTNRFSRGGSSGSSLSGGYKTGDASIVMR